MKVLIMYEYPPNPSGLATQGDLLYRGLQQMGVDVFPVHYESSTEKEWYYRWFHPDIAVGVGYWGYAPHLVQHPLEHGILPVPWFVADGYVANYRDLLNSLPLILVTSKWVRDVYIRDGVRGDHIQVLPVGCETDLFCPRPKDDPKVEASRRKFPILDSELMILTVGGDAASKGSQEVMQALAIIQDQVPDWKYVCKVWPQPRTMAQNRLDVELADQLGIRDRMIFTSDIVTRNYMPYLMNACDIYAAPSRLEGFGMPQVEAGACGKPVIGLQAMGMLDTLIHRKTALLARVGRENRIHETFLGPESGFEAGHRIVLDPPRVADYRADVGDIAQSLLELMNNPQLRDEMGKAGRERAVEVFDYRVVARQFVEIIQETFGIR